MWEIAMSPLDPTEVVARFEQLKRIPRKEAAMDALMTRLSTAKQAKAGLN